MAKLEALKLGKTAGKRFTFTRKTSTGDAVPVEVLIVPLSPTDIDRARIDAENYFESLPDAKTMPQTTRDEIVTDAREVETLSRALRDVDAPEDIFAGPAALRSLLTTNELGVLLKAYVHHQDDVGPLMSKLTNERLEGIIEAVAKTGELDPFVFFDSPTQKACIISMARLLWNSRTDRSSTTSDSCEPGSGSLSAAGPVRSDESSNETLAA
jgi:hypothetical protein